MSHDSMLSSDIYRFQGFVLGGVFHFVFLAGLSSLVSVGAGRPCIIV